MEGIIKADVFFFITAIAVIVLGSALAVLAIYAILISRDIRRIVTLVRAGAEQWAKGSFWASLMSRFTGGSAKRKRKVGSKEE